MYSLEEEEWNIFPVLLGVSLVSGTLELFEPFASTVLPVNESMLWCDTLS